MGSLQKNVAGQNFTFVMVNATTGAADTGATVAVKVTIDNGTQNAGAGTVTNKTNGQYNYAPTQAETNGTDLGFLLTAASDIPVNIDFHTDPVNLNLLAVDSNGNVSMTSNVKKNTALTGLGFLMTDSTTHNPKTGLGGTITATKSIDGAAYVATTNAPTEVGNGTYTINLTAADTNGNHIVYLFTAAASDNRYIEVITQP